MYKQYWEKIVKIYHNIVLDLVGNGCSTSLGFDAKYGTYTLMNPKTNEIIHCHVDHVAIAGNSIRIEKKGLTISL